MGIGRDMADSVADAEDAVPDASSDAESEGLDMTRTVVSMWSEPLGSAEASAENAHGEESDARVEPTRQADSPELADRKSREAEAREHARRALRDRDRSDGTPREQWDRRLRDAEPAALAADELDSRTSQDRLFLADDVMTDLNGSDLPHRSSGYFEVVVHGDQSGQFEARVMRPDGHIDQVPLSPEDLAHVIESRPAWNDRPVVLSSCWSAASGAELAERLGVAVYAPSSRLDITADQLGYRPDGSEVFGSVRVEPEPGGKWVRFEPSWSR